MSAVDKRVVRPETVVTTHTNADFDGLSSMLAATYIYPDAVPVLPDTAEAAVRRILEHPFFTTRQFYTWKTVDLTGVRTVVVVDAGTPERIGPVFRQLRDRGVHWIVYDTHPVSVEGIDVEVITAPYGATTTILVETLRRQNVRLSSLEATLIALGIYEDTGFFTFVGTHPADLQAAAYLLSQGADIRMIRDWLQIHLNEVQAACLREIRDHLEVLPIPGATVHFAGIRRSAYIPDLALVVHRLMDEMPIEVIFVALQTRRHVYLIGRSRSQRVDVGAILGAFGGGGHPYAGSASIADKTLPEVKETLTRVVAAHLPREPVARDIMAHPVKTISARTTVREAREWLNLLRVNALPVEDRGSIVGIVYRQTIDQALSLHLDDRPVVEIMAAPPPVVSQTASLDEVADAMLTHRSRLVLVRDNGSIVGVITRMALLQARYDWLQLSAVHLPRPGGRSLNFWRRVQRLLPEPWPTYLREIGDLAEASGWSAYLVGGTVRDIVMNQRPEDLDVLVEGPAIELARQWAERHGARVHSYERFGTAVVLLPDGQRVDFASARTEIYTAPGSPPRVEIGIVLRQDLFRRDFTMNAMALVLNPARRGQLIDPFGGFRDIHAGTIRVLHSLSFFEDPARILRAVRFAARYGFRLSPETDHLLQKARDAGVIEHLPGPRKGLELRYLFAERAVFEVFRWMTEYALWPHLYRKWVWRIRDLDQVRRAVEVFDWWRIEFAQDPPDRWMFWALVALQHVPTDERVPLVTVFQWPHRMHMLVRGVRDQVRPFMQWYRRHRRASPGDIMVHWRGWPVYLVLFVMVMGDARLQRLGREFLTRWQHAPPLLTGDDLRQIGIPPGPVYRDLLDRIWIRQVNGELRTRAEALRWLKRTASLSRTAANRRVDDPSGLKTTRKG